MKSPGHRKFPHHKVREERVDDVVKVKVDGVTIAESKDVIKVDEDKAPIRYYVARSDVRMETLQPTATTSECPFKGSANYFDIDVDGKRLKDAVWTYNAPYEEHADLAQRVAFYDDKYPDIRVTLGD